MKLSTESIVKNRQAWKDKGFIMPEYDTEAV